MLLLRSGPQLNELEILTLGYLQDAFNREKSSPPAKTLQVIATFMVYFDSEVGDYNFEIVICQNEASPDLGQKSCSTQTNVQKPIHKS